jgi:peptidoglycan/xylan/chitin deacetylase (PgdA/CDA1 family)
MTYEPSERRRPRQRRSVLDSPVVAALLVLIVVALGAAIVLVPGVLRPVGPGPTPSPTGPGATPTPAGPSAAPTFVRPTPSPAPTFLSYRVQPGDSLNSIARQFRTTARSIAWWNRGAYPSLDPESPSYDPNTIRVGWVLQVLPDTVVDETNPPTPSPAPATPAPTTGAVATPAPTTAAVATPAPVVAAPATVISHGPRTASNIALTFDMGGRLEPAVDIVRWLIDHEVHATLFPTGRSGSQTAEGLAAMQLAATRPDLFDLANHSWDHPDFRSLTASQMAAQLGACETAMLPIAGTTRPWFRPPFGGWNEKVRAGVGAAGWRYLVMWDVDTIDWRPVADGGPTTAGIVNKVASNARGGSIVLMHLGGWNTLESLPGILASVQARGLEPVTLSEMFGA